MSLRLGEAVLVVSAVEPSRTVNTYTPLGKFCVLIVVLFSLKVTLKAKLGKLSGEVDLEINSYGSVACFWQVSPDPIGTWLQVDLTPVSKTTIKGLTPGTKLWFRVSITKGKKQILVSDPHTIMVV